MMRERGGKWGWRRGEKGQALIEAAIAAPMFFLLLMGAAELGRIAYTAIEIQNAAEAGALYGALAQGAAGDQSGITLAAQNDAGNLTGVKATVAHGHYCSDGSSPASGSYACSTGTQETTVNVTTYVNFDPLVHIPGIPKSFYLGGYASEMCGTC
jgi:Flp pilus assembly protein TadG